MRDEFREIAQRDVEQVAERFWSKVDKHGPTMPHMRTCCWVWIAGKVNGYGTFTLPPERQGGHGRMISAHRISWVLTRGAIPKGKLVLHRCDNPGCVRPTHLFKGTYKDNAIDREAKGRGRFSKEK